MNEKKRKIMHKIEDLNETRAIIRGDMRDMEERKHKLTDLTLPFQANYTTIV